MSQRGRVVLLECGGRLVFCEGVGTCGGLPGDGAHPPRAGGGNPPEGFERGKEPYGEREGIYMKTECGMRADIESVLFTEEQIQEIVQRVGGEISRDYKDKNLLLVSVLKGSVVFMADLMRAITIPARIDFMATSSYGSGVKTSGVVKIVKDLDLELKGYDILIVEDILDSGKTLSYLMELLQAPRAQEHPDLHAVR